jgi:hypothetical protein
VSSRDNPSHVTIFTSVSNVDGEANSVRFEVLTVVTMKKAVF